MRRLVILVALTLGCSEGGPAGLDVADFAGPWELTVAPNDACFGVAGGGTRYFTVSTESFADGLFNVVAPWDVVQPNRGYGWTVTGNFNLRERTVQLRFWQQMLSVGSEFTGTIRGDGSVVGTLRDPIPGYAPHFVIGSCVFQAQGRRVSP